MKVELDLAERCTVIRVLPKEGNALTLQIIRNMVKKVGITAEEYEEYEIMESVTPEGQPVSQWNLKGTIPKEFEFSDPEVGIIKKELEKLDAGNKLDQYSLQVYEKFFK